MSFWAKSLLWYSFTVQNRDKLISIACYEYCRLPKGREKTHFCFFFLDGQCSPNLQIQDFRIPTGHLNKTLEAIWLKQTSGCDPSPLSPWSGNAIAQLVSERKEKKKLLGALGTLAQQKQDSTQPEDNVTSKVRGLFFLLELFGFTNYLKEKNEKSLFW